MCSHSHSSNTLQSRESPAEAPAFPPAHPETQRTHLQLAISKTEIAPSPTQYPAAFPASLLCSFGFSAHFAEAALRRRLSDFINSISSLLVSHNLRPLCRPPLRVNISVAVSTHAASAGYQLCASFHLGVHHARFRRTYRAHARRPRTASRRLRPL
jgi:hypothetical protein